MSNDLAKRLGGWTQDATVKRYDHADKSFCCVDVFEPDDSALVGGGRLD